MLLELVAWAMARIAAFCFCFLHPRRALFEPRACVLCSQFCFYLAMRCFQCGFFVVAIIKGSRMGARHAIVGARAIIRCNVGAFQVGGAAPLLLLPPPLLMIMMVITALLMMFAARSVWRALASYSSPGMKIACGKKHPGCAGSTSADA